LQKDVNVGAGVLGLLNIPDIAGSPQVQQNHTTSILLPQQRAIVEVHVIKYNRGVVAEGAKLDLRSARCLK
jgi:hypothetical protein